MKYIPYGRHCTDSEDIREVARVLRSNWITQGPNVSAFEKALARYCGARYAVAVSSGTAALHLACLAAGLKEGDEAITSPITFLATPNAVLYTGAKPVFADIDYNTVNINPLEIKRRVTRRTKAVLPIHFSGLPCRVQDIAAIAARNGLTVIEDACHAMGAKYKSNGKWIKLGSCAHSDMTVFSFHPVKHITTGEGGAITTNNKKYYKRLMSLRNHGIYKDKKTKKKGMWYYEMRELGFNYRITDIQCALGMSQMKRLARFIKRRREIAGIYNRHFKNIKGITIPFDDTNIFQTWHLYVLKIDYKYFGLSRANLMRKLERRKIGTQVHYIPVYRQPYYKHLAVDIKEFPDSEAYYGKALSIPMYPCMTDADVKRVMHVVSEALS